MNKHKVGTAVIAELQELFDRMEKLEAKLNAWTNDKPVVSSAETKTSLLLSLPDHLRKTYLVVIDNGKVTATDVSRVTHRVRAVESSYLNQLCNMHYLSKSKGQDNGDRRSTFFCPALPNRGGNS